MMKRSSVVHICPRAFLRRGFCVHACVCMYVVVFKRMHMYVRLCLRARVCERVCVRAWVRACVLASCYCC